MKHPSKVWTGLRGSRRALTNEFRFVMRSQSVMTVPQRTGYSRWRPIRCEANCESSGYEWTVSRVGPPFANRCLGESKLLHQRNMRRTDIRTTSALEAIHQVEFPLHFVILLSIGKQTQLTGIQKQRTCINAISTADAGILPALSHVTGLLFRKCDHPSGSFGDWNIQT